MEWYHFQVSRHVTDYLENIYHTTSISSGALLLSAVYVLFRLDLSTSGFFFSQTQLHDKYS